jgi:aspartyl-tRNA(Asn)/glutamyl-tRNA(Gln) amidotransferase subunit C
MPSRITPEEVAHVARLARLAVDDNEVARLVVELGEVLEHAQEVSALDTEGVPPSSHPLPFANVLRDDEVRPGLERSRFLAGAPAVEGDMVKVPRVAGEPA